MLASESTFWICLGKCAQWLLEIQDSRNRLSEWGVSEKSDKTLEKTEPGMLRSQRRGRGQSWHALLHVGDHLGDIRRASAHGYPDNVWIMRGQIRADHLPPGPERRGSYILNPATDED